jgi:hypothetical protein
MSKQVARFDSWCRAHGSYCPNGRPGCKREADHEDLLRGSLWDLQEEYTYLPDDAIIPDMCSNCGRHESQHVGNRCIAQPTRFKVTIT